MYILIKSTPCVALGRSRHNLLVVAAAVLVLVLLLLLLLLMMMMMLAPSVTAPLLRNCVASYS